MEFTHKYAIAFGGFLFIVGVLAFFIVAEIGTRVRGYLLGQVTCPEISQYPKLSQYLESIAAIPRLQLLILLLFLIANAVAMSLDVHDMAGFVKRSGLISVINLMPLFLGARMNSIANSCGISLNTYSRLHRWIARVVIIQGLIHVAATISQRKPDLASRRDRAAIAAASIFLVFLIARILRHHLYETYVYFHFLLAAGAIVTLYLHNPTNILQSPTLYLLIAILVQSAVALLWFAHVLYRNWTLNKLHNQACIYTITYKQSNDHPEMNLIVSDAIHVHIRLSRAWKPRAGQYVYLCIPSVSRMSFAQQHPYYVAWTYSSEGSNYAVFIIQKQHGFSEQLFSLKANTQNRIMMKRTIVEGPYGRELSLELYGTVILVATGIGIAGQLSYVAALLERYNNEDTKTRRIVLYWEVESEIHTAWVADRMQYLLDHDFGRILHIHLFVVDDFLSSRTPRGSLKPLGERIDMVYDAINPKVIRSELEIRGGRTVISLCANGPTRDRIRKMAQNMPNNDITFKELDFCPGEGSAKKSHS